VVELAKLRVQMPQPVGNAATPGTSLTDEEKATLGSVLGWTRASVPADLATWLQRIVGWIFTAIAVSLGAPFWFDTLSRFVNLRNTGNTPDKQGA
jgi:hypothetical protein